MPESVLPTHEAVLRLVASSAPQPWYPKVYAQTSGVPRDSLDVPLNELRMAGLARITEWEKHLGQGYVLTPLGEELMKNPLALARFRTGGPAVASQDVDETIAEEGRSSVPTPFERGEIAREALINPRPPRVIPVLILLNVIAFGVSFVVASRAGVPTQQFLLRGNPVILNELGALTAIGLIHGEWWRLLTCCFLHFGLIHLAMNMYSLYALGFVESLWGPARFLALYLISGIGCCCVAMIFYSPMQNITMAGASGAIWGIMCSFVAWLVMNRSHIPPQQLAAEFRMLGTPFIINILVSFLPGISAAGHFGGGIAGFITGTLLHVQRFAAPPRRTAAAVLIALLPVLSVAALMEKMKKDDQWHLRAEMDQLQKRKSLVDAFNKDIRPAIETADAACQAMQTAAYAITDDKERNPAKVEKVLQQARAASVLVKDALNKLGENPPADAKVEAAFTAAKDYMQTLDDWLKRIDDLLKNKTEWSKEERITIEKKKNEALSRWLEAKKQL